MSVIKLVESSDGLQMLNKQEYKDSQIITVSLQRAMTNIPYMETQFLHS
jgi:hypothetical protein